jgi:hypothetical protein
LKRVNNKRQPGDKPEPEQENPDVRKKVKLEGKSGATYEGETLRGKYDGTGIYIDSLMKYEGKWLAGKKHGHGIMTYNTGLKNEITFAGNFSEDKL